MSTKHLKFLEGAYNEALREVKNRNYTAKPNTELSLEAIEYLDTIVDNVDSFLGVNNVLITSIVEKSINPTQDIRYHQAKMEGGYSGRTLDTNYIAPFLKSKKLKSMVESGWLTRSLEQDAPYDFNYPGAIRSNAVKEAFLKILDLIQNKNLSPKLCLDYYLQKLIVKQEEEKISIDPLPHTSKFSIEEMVYLLEKHFYGCNGSGKAKLPVIAVYSMYECLIDELKRFQSCELLPLGHHTSADLRSKAIGDIQVNDENDEPYEGVEIKFDKPITKTMVLDSFEKFKALKVRRYYLLSTIDPTPEDKVAIDEAVSEIKETHGCQVIANGLIYTLKYYLRLLSDTDNFLLKYTNNISNDGELKHEYKKAWEDILYESD